MRLPAPVADGHRLICLIEDPVDPAREQLRMVCNLVDGEEPDPERAGQGWVLGFARAAQLAKCMKVARSVTCGLPCTFFGIVGMLACAKPAVVDDFERLVCESECEPEC